MRTIKNISSGRVKSHGPLGSRQDSGGVRSQFQVVDLLLLLLLVTPRTRQQSLSRTRGDNTGTSRNYKVLETNISTLGFRLCFDSPEITINPG